MHRAVSAVVMSEDFLARKHRILLRPRPAWEHETMEEINLNIQDEIQVFRRGHNIKNDRGRRMTLLPSGLAVGQEGRKHAGALGAAGRKRIGAAPDTPAIPEEGNSDDDDDSDEDSDEDSSQEADKKEEPGKDRRKAFAAASKSR